jgi:hypothetical protein
MRLAARRCVREESTIIASQELDENASVSVLLCETGQIILQPYSEERDEIKLTPRQAKILLSFLLESLSHGGNNEMPSL